MSILRPKNTHPLQERKRLLLRVVSEAVESIFKAKKTQELSPEERDKLITTLEMNFGVSKRTARSYISTVEKWLTTK